MDVPVVDLNDAISAKEAGELLHRSEVTLERWRRLRIGPPFYRIQGRVLYLKADIAAWLAEKRVAA